MPKEILYRQNERIAFRLNDDFSASLTDKTTRTEWTMAPVCYQEIGPLSDMAIWNRGGRCYMDRYPSFFKATPAGGDRVEVAIMDPLREERGKITCAVTLDQEWIRFEIESIDEQLPSLIFPPYIESESLLIPSEIGQWHREPIPEARFIMPASGWNMRWFGGLRGDKGWMAIVHEGYPDSGVYMSNMSACAAWQKTLGKWAGKKTVLIGFSDNGYVGMAKKFRAYAQANGLHKTLREKIQEVPSVGNLIGGRCINMFQAYTHHAENDRLSMSPVTPESAALDGKVQVLIDHRDALTIINEAKSAGMQKGYFNLRGWLKGGYDDSHPDVWPPEPLLGSLDDFRKLTRQSGPFTTLLHDNYQDIYPQSASFPQWVMRTPDGRFKAGGTWHGGRCYVINSAKAIEHARRNWEHFKTIDLKGIFLDTIGGAHFQEDYSPEHLLTRGEDARSKYLTAEFFKKQGLLVGTEYGSDFSSPVVDFVETRTTRVPGFSIPLFQLVYHDSVVTLRYNQGTNDSVAASDTEDMLWGYAKMWPAGTLENWRSRLGAFKSSMQVDQWHGKIGLDEMTNHRYLDPDFLVEQTEFSSGASIIANFSHEAFEYQGATIPPGSSLQV